MAYKNKEDQAIAAHNHYLENKDKLKARAKKYTQQHRIRVREFILNIKKNSKCLDCNLVDFRVLDFHHVSNDKEICIASATNWSIDRLQKEIDKCILLCANCHRIRHYTN